MFECFFCDNATFMDKDEAGAHISDHFSRGDSTGLSRFLKWLQLTTDAETDKLMVKFYFKEGA